jgi:mono/diheme cytochrome c family protein
MNARLEAVVIRSAAVVVAIAAISIAGAAGSQTGMSGAELYEEHCELCHEADGSGSPGDIPPLAGNPTLPDTDYLTRVIRDGLSGPIVVLGVDYDDEMDGFPELSDDEVATIVTYIQGGFGAGATSEVKPEPEPVIPGDILRGERIFSGEQRLASGGPSCYACHTAGAYGHLGGTGFGPDLTALRDKFAGDDKLAAAIRKPPSPVMRQVYAGHELNEQEVADLRTFFAQTDASEHHGTDWLIILGVIGAVVLLVLITALSASLPKRSYSRMLRDSK